MRVGSSIAALLSIVILFGACSSSTPSSSKSSSSATTTTSVSSAAVDETTFVAQVKQVCDQSNAALSTAATQAFDGRQPTVDQWQPFMVTTVLPLIDARLQAIKATAAPPSDTAKIRDLLDAGTAAVQSARQNPQQLAPGTRAPFDHFDDLATEDGYPDCAVGG